jgi:hypothetical protein
MKWKLGRRGPLQYRYMQPGFVTYCLIAIYSITTRNASRWLTFRVGFISRSTVAPRLENNTDERQQHTASGVQFLPNASLSFRDHFSTLSLESV